MKSRFNFWSALVGGLVAALAVSAVPAIAAQVGDALALGQVNTVHAKTVLKGNAGTQPNLVVRSNGTQSPLLLQTFGNGRPPMIVDSTKRVASLNADLVDSRHANTLIRAAYASSPEIDEGIFSGGAADILTTTITAPKDGLLVVGASVDASGATDDQYTCQILVDGFVVAGSSRVSRVNWAGVGHTDNSQENCSTDAVQVVAAGPHAVDFRVSGRNTASLHSATLWVIYVPYGSNGAVPVP